nr:MAG TPA: hypothetical protein [Caudoviricetes sp.]
MHAPLSPSEARRGDFRASVVPAYGWHLERPSESLLWPRWGVRPAGPPPVRAWGRACARGGVRARVGACVRAWGRACARGGVGACESRTSVR